MRHSKFAIIYLLTCLVLASAALGADLSREVIVTYAFVPKIRLADAVKGKAEALAAEAKWRDESVAQKGFPPYPMNLTNQKYSIVVFIEVPAKFAVSGRIGIPIQNPKSKSILNVNLSAGYLGIYVIDGGGVVLTHGIPVEPKKYDWLEFHAE